MASYSQADPTPGTDTPVNEVKFTYDGLGRATKSQQEHAGAVDGSTPDVDYTYTAPFHGRLAPDPGRLPRRQPERPL